MLFTLKEFICCVNETIVSPSKHVDLFIWLHWCEVDLSRFYLDLTYWPMGDVPDWFNRMIFKDLMKNSTFVMCNTPWIACIIALEQRWMSFTESKLPKYFSDQGQWLPFFNTNSENPKMHIWCKSVDSSSYRWKVIVQTNQIYYDFKSKWPKWPWRSKSKTSIFNTSRDYLIMHVLCKFGYSSPNLSGDLAWAS